MVTGIPIVVGETFSYHLLSQYCGIESPFPSISSNGLSFHHPTDQVFVIHLGHSPSENGPTVVGKRPKNVAILQIIVSLFVGPIFSSNVV